MTQKSFIHPDNLDSVLLCFSHLRWDFVFQRPQHLLVRAAHNHRVIYIEEPAFERADYAFLRVAEPVPRLSVVTPVLPHDTSPEASLRIQRDLIDQLVATAPRGRRLLWYYTPMALRFSSHLAHNLCIYDCMDELSAFKGAPAELSHLEQMLFGMADIVFTGGQSLYEVKRAMHPAVYSFPSSIDAAHFRRARLPMADPPDQRDIPYPRIGFFGVIDERMDLALVAQVAGTLPHVHFVMLGPTAKIDPATLPLAPNLHWLGRKSYAELPAYMANWQAGWMPFALNESTRYISPTKTPEFLAAGLPAVSTAVVDVVRSYGAAGLVDIADLGTMPSRLESALARPRKGWLERVDMYLAEMSWDETWAQMAALIERALDLEEVGSGTETLQCSTG